MYDSAYRGSYYIALAITALIAYFYHGGDIEY